MYKISTLASGGVPVVAPEKDLTTDVDAMLACVTDRTRLVFLANPNNPTGTYLPFEEVRRLHAGLPDNVILVLDAAYAEYVRRNDYSAGIDLVANANNVVMMRTFSKIHGLAALRLGWAFCPEGIADILNRVRGPFNVNAPAIAAGVAAIGDAAFMDRAVALNERWLPWLTGELETLVNNEVAALERAYSDNEDRMKRLVSTIQSERLGEAGDRVFGGGVGDRAITRCVG